MKLLTTVGQLLLLIFLGFLAREAWRIYAEQSRIDRVAKDAVRLKVRVDHVSKEKKSWRDQLSNSKYVDFRYEDRTYTLRYSQDSVFLQEGSLIPVYYSPSADEFVQYVRGLRQQERYKTSVLVRFTVVRLMNVTHAILGVCCVLTVLWVIFALGIVARLTGIGFLWKIQNAIAGICALLLAVYFSYNALANWRYYSKIKNGVTQQVKVEDIYQTKDAPTHYTSDDFVFTVYRAVVIYRGEPMLIAVGQKDFEQVHKGEELTVLYDAGLDDMMGANYSLLAADYIFPIVVWVILLVAFFSRRQRQQQTRSPRPPAIKS